MMKRPRAVADVQSIGVGEARAYIGFRGFDRGDERKIFGEARGDSRRERAARPMRVSVCDARRSKNCRRIPVA